MYSMFDEWHGVRETSGMCGGSHSHTSDGFVAPVTLGPGTPQNARPACDGGGEREIVPLHEAHQSRPESDSR